jgi:selenocysteine lyase/cysteine desulfurase
MARKHGIPVLVDGAHAFATLAYSREDLECDYYAVSLHKWLLAPHGTGFLYLQKDRIGALWPMQAAPPEMDTNIRKFEEIGTHPAANILAISEALTFHNGIGARRKEERLRYLRDYWAGRLLKSDRIRLHTSLKPGFSTGMGTVEIEGVDTGALNEHLWTKHRIFTVAIKHPEFEGLRISPNVYTTLEELDRFCDAMERVVKNGLGG